MGVYNKKGVWYTDRKIPLGAFVDSEIGVNWSPKIESPKGYWKNARPEPYYSFFTRLKMAWDVLRYKADALYWEVDL